MVFQQLSTEPDYTSSIRWRLTISPSRVNVSTVTHFHRMYMRTRISCSTNLRFRQWLGLGLLLLQLIIVSLSCIISSSDQETFKTLIPCHLSCVFMFFLFGSGIQLCLWAKVTSLTRKKSNSLALTFSNLEEIFICGLLALHPYTSTTFLNLMFKAHTSIVNWTSGTSKLADFALRGVKRITSIAGTSHYLLLDMGYFCLLQEVKLLFFFIS